MNWYNEIKTSLDWNNTRNVEPSITDEKNVVLQEIDNAITANKVNIQKTFQQLYPNGMSAEGKTFEEILIELQEPVKDIVATLLDTYHNIPFHPMSEALLTNSIFGIAVNAVGLGHMIKGKEI